MSKNKTKMLVSILTSKPYFRGYTGFYGITLFSKSFLGVDFGTYDTFDITILKSEKYRQVYVGVVLFFFSVGLNLAWRLEGDFNDW
jgi:hypothetical protein